MRKTSSALNEYISCKAGHSICFILFQHRIITFFIVSAQNRFFLDLFSATAVLSVQVFQGLFLPLPPVACSPLSRSCSNGISKVQSLNWCICACLRVCVCIFDICVCVLSTYWWVPLGRFVFNSDGFLDHLCEDCRKRLKREKNSKW